MDLPADFRVTLDCAVEGNVLYGGDPFMRVTLDARQAQAVRRWRDGGTVDDDGALARALTEVNLAQPVPRPYSAPVSVVIPVRDRPELLARLLATLDQDDVIVIDDADGEGPGAARNHGLARAKQALVVCLDADVLPRPGWLQPLVAHFADPAVQVVAARVTGADRGTRPARVKPYGRVPFVPGAALVMRREHRFDDSLSGGEDVDLAWRVHTRYEPRSVVEHPAPPWRRRLTYGRNAAPLSKLHPGQARPLHVNPWTAAAWLAAGLQLPTTALAITATATALLARTEPHAIRIAALGTLRSGRTIGDALMRAYWPLSLAAAFAIPRTRPALLAAALTQGDPAYGAGLWLGCLEHRTLDPLIPGLGWRMTNLTGAQLIDLWVDT